MEICRNFAVSLNLIRLNLINSEIVCGNIYKDSGITFFLQQEEPHQQSQSIRDGFYTIAIIIVKRIMHVKLITY